MQEISGKIIASRILEQMRTLPKPKTFLAAIAIGRDPESESFLKQKQASAKRIGIDFRIYHLAQEQTNDQLRREVGKIARQQTVGGVIVQLPLPLNVNRNYVLNAIPREKDVDVLGARALGAFYDDDNPVLPPSVGAAEAILKEAGVTLEDKTVGVVGLGPLIGKPIAVWLMKKCRNLVLFNKRSEYALLSHADIVITGVGEPAVIKGEFLKRGAGVIDFGYRIVDGKIRGDLDISTLQPSLLAFYTPTPGGTGPVLVTKLFENFYTLAGKTASRTKKNRP